MPKLGRIYLHAMIGALGGWLGGRPLAELSSRDGPCYNQALFGVAMIGSCIGFGIAALEAILDRSLLRFLRFAAVGILLGGIGGAAGYWVGDWVNNVFVQVTGATGFLAQAGSVVARILGWALFGLAV